MLTGEVDEYSKMPVFDGKEGRKKVWHNFEGWKVKYNNFDGWWELWVGDKPLYSQPLNPRSPAPTAQGWQCLNGLPPAPQATLSLQLEVVMCAHRGRWWG